MKKLSWCIESDNSMSFFYDGKNVILGVVLRKDNEDNKGVWTGYEEVGKALVTLDGVNVLSNDRYIILKKIPSKSITPYFVPADADRNQLISGVKGLIQTVGDKLGKRNFVEYGVIPINRYTGQYYIDAMNEAKKRFTFNEHDSREQNRVLAELEYRQIMEYLNNPEKKDGIVRTKKKN